MHVHKDKPKKGVSENTLGDSSAYILEGIVGIMKDARTKASKEANLLFDYWLLLDNVDLDLLRLKAGSTSSASAMLEEKF